MRHLTVETTIQESDRRVRVTVQDYSPLGIPSSRPPIALDKPNGRGLHLVDHLAAAWGISPCGADDESLGKSVWFELRSPVRADEAAALPS